MVTAADSLGLLLSQLTSASSIDTRWLLRSFITAS